MPRGNYNRKLTYKEILWLVDKGKYRVDLDTGIVYSGRTWKPVYTYSGQDYKYVGDKKDHGNYLWLRLYKSPGYRTMPVAHVIWIVGTRTFVPKGFEVHHEDENRTNNAFLNLYCLHNVDHRKKHRRESLVPF